MSTCQIHLFGAPTITKDGSVQSGLRSKSLALLSYLAVEDRPIGRDTVATLLWPECGQSAARRNLRTCLFEIRHVLPQGAVVTEGNALRLSAADLWIDVHELLRIPEERPCADAIARCCPAGFMEGFTLTGCPGFDNWQTITSEMLQRRLETLLARAVQGLIRSGNASAAVPPCQRLVNLDPLEEAYHRLMMRVYAACSRWAAAEQQYHACRAVLREELGASPEEETDKLAQAVVRRDPALSSAGTLPAAVPVPAEVSRFFGRTAEIRQVEDRLLSGTRIVTLTGPAGAGKTRLAVRVAHRLRDRFPDGTAFVDLTRARSPDQALTVVTAAIGLREQSVGERTQVEFLARHLDGRRLLIVMDNFEHVILAASKVASLAERSADVRILVTSREPLDIRGEAVIAVPPFEIPGSVDPDEMAASPVIRLLADRARLADPTFRLTAENAEAIRDLCAVLDGLPLAIELAIPLLRVYSPADLVGRLARPLRVLRTGGADRPARHQSLERAIEWSYDLLDPEERALFSSLSVFAGGFDLAAVEQICRPGSGVRSERLLQALLEKSLVHQRSTAVGLRFELLESTREYAEAKAAGMPGAEALRSRHADYYRAYALQAEAGMRGAEQVQWFEALTLAGGNTTLALAHFHEAQRWEAGLEMACALSWYWYRSGQFGVGARWVDAFLSRCPDTPSRLRARGLHLKGWFTFVLGDWRTAHGLYGESLYMARQVSDGACECLALSDLGLAERWLGNRSRGWDYAFKAVEVARTLGDADLLSRTLIWAYATTGGAFVGEPPLAQLEEAAALARTTGNEWIFAHAYNGLGDLCRELGQYDRARQAYQTALSGFTRLADRYLCAWTLEGLGQVEMRVGNRGLALEQTVEALTLFDGLGDELTVATLLARVAVLAREDHRPEALALIAGAASVLLEHQASRGLSGAPQVAEAVDCITGLELEDSAAWLRGQALTRAAAVVAARQLVVGVHGTA